MDDDHSNGSTRADRSDNPSSTLRLRESETAPQGRDADDGTDAEARMRQALGLFGTRSPAHADRGHHDQHGGGRSSSGGGGAAGSRRHRFVQDGEVPVSVVRGRAAQPRSGGTDGERHGEEQLAAERQARADAERRLADRETQLRSLQTRIGHAELERDAALADAREWRDKAEQIMAESRHAAPASPSPSEAEASPTAEQWGSLGEGGVARRGAGRRRAEEADSDRIDPEPVKWWL